MTGPKVDLWLVNTVGALLAVAGLVLLVAGWRDRCSLDVGLLALGSAGVLVAIEVVYVLLGPTSPIYRADAGVESVFIVLWLRCWRAWRYRLNAC